MFKIKVLIQLSNNRFSSETGTHKNSANYNGVWAEQ